MITPHTGNGSLGFEVARYAKATGQAFMPWQTLALVHLLATQKDRLCHRQGLISVARQNGKSTLAEALIRWWLTERALTHGPQTVVLVTHDLRLTTVLFHRIVATLERAGLIAKARWSHGRQDAELVNGSAFYVQSNAPSAGHGLSVDLVVVDEVWDINESTLDQGLLPSQRARPEPFLLMLSTAGDENSSLFRRWREQGLALIDAKQSGVLAMCEWSPPAGVDPLDESWWPSANPALGITITIDALRAEAQAPNRNAFMRASLNLWVSNAKGWLEPHIWSGLTGALPAFQGGVLAIESSLDGQRFVGVRAVNVNGLAAVRVEFVEADEQALWKRTLDAMQDPALTLACSAALSVHLPLTLQKRHVPWTVRELGRWVPLVRSYLNSERVVHGGEHALTEHVTRAVTSRVEGGEPLSSTRSPGPIELARTMVIAVALATKPTWQRKAAIGGAV